MICKDDIVNWDLPASDWLNTSYRGKKKWVGQWQEKNQQTNTTPKTKQTKWKKKKSEENLWHLHGCEFVAHLEITVIIMPFSKRHNYIQVVLKTIDHRWHHQITRLVILQKKRRQVKRSETANLQIKLSKISSSLIISCFMSCSSQHS